MTDRAMREETGRTRHQESRRGTLRLSVGAWSLVLILGCAGPPPMDRATGIPAQVPNGGAPATITQQGKLYGDLDSKVRNANPNSTFRVIVRDMPGADAKDVIAAMDELSQA